MRVRPGVARARVGGRYGEPGSGAAVLTVAVTQRAVEGAATAAVLAAVADAFGLKRGSVRLVTGERSRTKVLDLDGDDEALSARLAALLAS